jgi:peroxiredoxin Q/BCP
MTDTRRSKRLAGATEGAAKTAPAKKVRPSTLSKKNETPAEKVPPADDEQDATVVKQQEKPSSAVLKVGDTIVDVDLQNEAGETVSVLSLTKDKGVVFFMFPKAATPGCTKQACGRCS